MQNGKSHEDAPTALLHANHQAVRRHPSRRYVESTLIPRWNGTHTMRSRDATRQAGNKRARCQHDENTICQTDRKTRRTPEKCHRIGRGKHHDADPHVGSLMLSSHAYHRQGRHPKHYPRQRQSNHAWKRTGQSHSSLCDGKDDAPVTRHASGTLHTRPKVIAEHAHRTQTLT